MASGSRRAIRSSGIWGEGGRGGNNTGGQYNEYPGLENISGRWKGKRDHMHCDGVRSAISARVYYHQPCILTGNR